MKALSIRQPWAWLIVHGIKDIENRTWQTKLRGKVFIHAPLKFDMAAYQRIDYIMPPKQELEIGGIIGTVEIIDCVTKSNSKWFNGPFGFKLINPTQLSFIPCKGQLSFFQPKL